MMTVHVLHAGDGYTYLTRQVANGDARRLRGESLADYYAHEGNPPGRWVGAGMAGVGVAGQVSEDQMRALFGEGLHPDADRLIAEKVQEGASVDQAIDAVRLGRRFPQFAQVEDQEEWRSSIAAAYEAFTNDHGRSPEVGPERDLIRWNIAGEMITAGRGRPPQSDAERSAFIARVGKQQRHPVAGYDLVFTPVKSVSTLWALADSDTRHEIAAAHEAAWKGAFAWIEREAGLTRTGAGGVAQIDTNGLMAAAFDHADSRTGDPNLHTHVAVSNKVQSTVDGKWRALDARVLHALGVAASERYNALVEQELVTRLGVVFVDEQRGRARQPVREIAGIDAGVRAAFSSRRAAIEDSYKELITDYRATHGHEPSTKTQLRLAQQATLETREGKEPGVTLSERRAQWQATAAQVLGSEQAVEEMIANAVTGAITSADSVDPGQMPEVGPEVDTLAQTVLREVAGKRATWGRWHLLAEATRQVRGNPGSVPVDVLAEQVADRAEALSIPLDPPELNPVPAPLQRGDGESIYTVRGTRRFTSTGVLNAEDEVLQGALRRGGIRARKVHFDAALKALETRTGRTLDPAQRALAEAFATSGREVAAGIGPAGTGKTTAMQAFAQTIQNAGGRVIALAPSAAAATILGDELGVRGETLHKLLHDHERGYITRGLEIDANTVLLVDEAGMAGTPQLAAVVALARQHRASIRLLGDPGQLAAIGAGGVLRLVDERIGAARLDKVHRFTGPAEAAASIKLREGKIDGLDFYIDGDRVRSGTREDMITEVFTAWKADTDAGDHAVMITPTNADATALAAQARRARVQAGEVEPGGITLEDGNTAGIGDRIVTRRNNRDLGTANGKDFVKNGDTWTILDRDPAGRLRARHVDHGGTVTLPAEYVASQVQLAYAATVHRVQGMTTDTAHALVDANATNRPSLYTAATRGREMNRLYVMTEITADTEGHVPDKFPMSGAQGLAKILTREGEDISATSAQERAWHYAHSLEKLVPEFHDARMRIMEPRAQKLAETAIGVLGQDRAQELTRDPAWHQVAARLATHEDGGGDPGALLREANAPAARDITEERISPAVAFHRHIPPPPADEHQWTTLPATPGGDPEIRAWAERHRELIEQRIDLLTDQAAGGIGEWLKSAPPAPEPTTPRFDQWITGVREVVAYRDRYAITGTAPLGPEPENPGQRADYDHAMQGLHTMRTPRPEQREAAHALTAREEISQFAKQQRQQIDPAAGTPREQMRRALEELERHQQKAQKQQRTRPPRHPHPQQRPPEPRGPSL